MTTQREQFQSRRIKSQQDYINDLEGTIRLLLRDLEFTESVGCGFAYDAMDIVQELVSDRCEDQIPRVLERLWADAVDEATGGTKKSAEDLVSL